MWRSGVHLFVALAVLLGSWFFPSCLAAQELSITAKTAAGAALLRGHSQEGRQGSRLITSGGKIFHRTERRVMNLRTVPVPTNSTELYLWEEETPEGETHPFYAISFDGLDIAGRVRRTAYTVELEGFRFDPAKAEPSPYKALSAAEENTLYLVQFFTTPLPEFRAAIGALGGTIHGFLTHHTYLVKMPRKTLKGITALPYVRWVGSYHPAYRLETSLYKALTGQQKRLEYQRYSILLCERGPDPQQVVATLIRKLGGEVHLTTPQGFRMEVSLSHDQLAELIFSDEVQYVDRWGGPGETDMDIVRITGGADFVEHTVGLGATGLGVNGEVFDTGLLASHQEWKHQLPILHALGGTDDAHGTSVYSNLFAQGIEPAARGVLPDGQGIFFPHRRSSQFGGQISRYTIHEELLDPLLEYRAVFQSSSVGSKPTLRYSTISAEMDDILFLHPLVTTQSQGNEGYQSSRPQAWAKNIVSCGAVWHENTVRLRDDSGRSPASTGPATDGRIKPDLAFFFDSIHSASNASDSSYTNVNGTSTATPQTAGYFGLLHQLWHQGLWLGHGGGASVFDSRPGMATAKALMIHGAKRYDWVSCGDCSIDRFKQGWGRPDLKRLVTTADRTDIIDETDLVGPLGIKTYSRFVRPGDDELKATLVYTDPKGMPAAAVARVNDLSLRLQSPSGEVFWGNHGLTMSNVSLPGGASNTVDTVENVFVRNPEKGLWTIKVIADEVVEDSHLETAQIDADYALVVSSAPLETGCSISADFEDSTEGFEFVPLNEPGVSGDLVEGALTISVLRTQDRRSGQWRKVCSTFTGEKLSLAIDLRLTQSGGYLAGEISEAFVLIDAQRYTLVEIVGDGPRGEPQTVSGIFELELELAAGPHEIAIGCSSDVTGAGGGTPDRAEQSTECRIDAVMPAEGPTSVVEADYDLETDVFTFLPDPENPDYTSGRHLLDGGTCTCQGACRCGGAIEVQVGGMDDNPVFDMVGKWSRRFTASAETVTVTLDASLTQTSGFGSDEFSEARLAVDGQRVVLSRFARARHEQTTRFQPFSAEFNLETRAEHSIDLECFNSKKDSMSEKTTCLFDDVRITATVPCPFGADFERGKQGWANDPASTCTAGSFVVGTPREMKRGRRTTQVGGDHSTGKGNALFSAFNAAPRAGDVDGGNCIVNSPLYRVLEDSEVSILYFHGQHRQGDDATGDFFLLEMSTDGGSTFSPLASFGDVISEAEWREATATVLAGSDVRFRVQVSDGPDADDVIEAGIDDLSICATGAVDTPPQISIDTPADCGNVTAGQPITFAATAVDLVDGDLSANLSWTSSLDGALGSGGLIVVPTLSVGTHGITASVSDSGDQTATQSITLTVHPP